MALALRDAMCRQARPRIPEPMVVDDPAAVARFSEGSAAQPAMLSVYDFSARALNALVPKDGRVLDLGVGSGSALAYFLQRRPDVTAVGVDLSAGMLEQAQAACQAAGVAARVQLLEADICQLPEAAVGERVDAVCSIWTLHQLPGQPTLAAALESVAGVRERHGAAVWLLDFQRMPDSRTFPALLAATDPDYPAGLRQDAIDSEAAAFTAAELREQLALAGLGAARHRTSRPLRFLHAAWLAGQRDAAGGAQSWIEKQPDRDTARRAAMLQRAFGTSRKAPLPRGTPASDTPRHTAQAA